MTRRNPKSQSSATRIAKALEAASADLDVTITGLRTAATLYRQGHWIEAAEWLQITLDHATMPLHLLRTLN